MTQYKFGNNGTTYEVELQSGVAVSSDRGFSVDAYGAKGDGSTDDASAFASAHDAAVAAGGGFVYGSPGKTYVLDSGLTWNINRVRFDGLGCVLDASSLSSGAAITLVGPTERYSHKYGLSNFTLVGPGEASSVTGILFDEDASQRSAKASIYNVHVQTFGVGVDWQTNGFISSLFYCQLEGCGVGVQCLTGFTNYGENLSLYGCTVFNGGTGIKLSNANCDMYLFGTSIDYNDVSMDISGSAVLSAYGCHLECSTANTAAQFVMGEGSRLMLSGCHISRAGTPASNMTTFVEFPSSVTAGAEPIVRIRDSYLFNIGTTDGDLATGEGILSFDGNYGPGTMYIPDFTHSSANCAPWGDFELDALPSAVHLNASTYTITDPHTAGSDTLTLDATYAQSGTQSLKITKVDGGGTNYKVGFLVPVDRGQFTTGVKFALKKTVSGGGAATCWYEFYHALWCGDFESDGRPKLARSDSRGTTTFTVPNDAFDWTEYSYPLDATPSHLPSWCTHLYVVLNFVNYDGTTCPLWLDDFSVGGI